MSILFYLLRYSFTSILWGFLIAVICMALFVVIIKGWRKDAQFSVASYLVGAVLLLLLSVQCILIAGSLKIIDTTDYCEAQVERIVENAYSSTELITISEADDVVKNLIYEYPFLQHFISGGEFEGYTAMQLPHAIADELRSYMHWYIFRRILWCLGFVLVGAFIVIKTMDTTRSLQMKQRRPIGHTSRYDDF